MRENLLIFLPWLSLPLPMASCWSPIPDCFLLSYFFVLIRPLPSHLFFSRCFLSHSTSLLSLHLPLISASEPLRRLCLPPGMPIRAPSPQQPPSSSRVPSPPLGRTHSPLSAFAQPFVGVLVLVRAALHTAVPTTPSKMGRDSVSLDLTSGRAPDTGTSAGSLNLSETWSPY